MKKGSHFLKNTLLLRPIDEVPISSSLIGRPGLSRSSSVLSVECRSGSCGYRGEPARVWDRVD